MRIEAQRQMACIRQGRLERDRQAIGGNHIETDARTEHTACRARSGIATVQRLEYVDFAGDIQIMRPCLHTGISEGRGSCGKRSGAIEQQRHAGQDTAILAARHALYVQARERNPARWSRDTRNWSPVGAVTLNPERDAVVSAAADGPHTQQMAA